jgi:hypothetical protein
MPISFLGLDFDFSVHQFWQQAVAGFRQSTILHG